MALRLWKTFLERIDVCYKIIHIPTDEIDVFTAINGPSDASVQTLALCFAIYYASVVVLDDCDVAALFQGNRILALHQFKLGLEQALAQARFLEQPTVRLLQAIAIYLVSALSLVSFRIAGSIQRTRLFFRCTTVAVVIGY